MIFLMSKTPAKTPLNSLLKNNFLSNLPPTMHCHNIYLIRKQFLKANKISPLVLTEVFFLSYTDEVEEEIKVTPKKQQRGIGLPGMGGPGGGGGGGGGALMAEMKMKRETMKPTAPAPPKKVGLRILVM